MMNSTLDDIGIRLGTDKSSKGHDFLRHYENVFSSIKNDAFTLLEIGGLNGASLAMWKEYFPNARIICIDSDAKIKQYEADGIHVEIGSSGSPAFLEQIKKQYGPLRIIIDDGSHRWDHQRTAFQILFSAVEAGGYYVVEDIHTSYESGFSGTDDFPFVEYLKLIVDYINLRGEYKKSFESRFSKQFVANAKDVDHISFVPRSCIIKKKALASRRDTDLPYLGAFKSYDQIADQLYVKPDRQEAQKLRNPPLFGEIKRKATVTAIYPMDDYIVGLNDVTCIPRQVLVCQDKLLPDTFRRRNSRLDHVQIERIGDEFRILVSDTPTRTIEDQCFFLDGEHADHFGHLTLEVLSRLWAFKHLELSNLKFVISARNLGPVSALVEPFGISSDQLIQFRQPILCKKLIVASQSYVLENSASPNALAVWSKVGTHYARPNTPEKIYVSRRKWQKQRRLVNEEQVEKIFSDRGFRIIHPEEMSIPDQVAFFRGAKFVAGPSGSGMYNTIYCMPGAKILVLISADFITLNDSLIHSLVDLETEYLSGKVIDKERGGMFDNWQIDLDLVRRRVDLI